MDFLIDCIILSSPLLYTVLSGSTLTLTITGETLNGEELMYTTDLMNAASPAFKKLETIYCGVVRKHCYMSFFRSPLFWRFVFPEDSYILRDGSRFRKIKRVQYKWFILLKMKKTHDLFLRNHVIFGIINLISFSELKTIFYLWTTNLQTNAKYVRNDNISEIWPFDKWI